MMWIIKKLPILIPVLLLLGLCLVGVLVLVAQNIEEGFGITDSSDMPEAGDPSAGAGEANPDYSSPYCDRIGDAGPGNPFYGYPTSNTSFHSAGYIGTDFCDPDYPFEWDHEGLDFLFWGGTPVVATTNGTVVQAGFDANLGNLVVLCSSGFCARYGHMQSLNVFTGQPVAHGHVIGYVGNTGGSTTGVHLHYDNYNAEGFWDPFPTLNR